MNAVEAVFNQDMILDESAFNQAVSDFADLSVKLQNLRGEIEDMLEALKTGFNTPAGAKLINSCEKNLLKPLDDQKLVLDHISKTLRESRDAYSAVFREYEALQSTIQQAV